MLNINSNNARIKMLEHLGYTPFKMSDGNKKLVPNETTAYQIWNLPAEKTCPFASDDCKKFCYAKKAERCYPDCLPARERNLEASRRDDFVYRMILTLLKKRKSCRKARLIVRIHESGDFYSLDYVEKWLRIMRALEGEDIVFIAYTKSFPFFNGKALPSNFSLRASTDLSTSVEQLRLVVVNDWNTYNVVERFQTHMGARCRCENCATCNLCIRKDIKHIQCEIH